MTHGRLLSAALHFACFLACLVQLLLTDAPQFASVTLPFALMLFAVLYFSKHPVRPQYQSFTIRKTSMSFACVFFG